MKAAEFWALSSIGAHPDLPSHFLQIGDRRQGSPPVTKQSDLLSGEHHIAQPDPHSSNGPMEHSVGDQGPQWPLYQEVEV